MLACEFGDATRQRDDTVVREDIAEELNMPVSGGRQATRRLPGPASVVYFFTAGFGAAGAGLGLRFSSKANSDSLNAPGSQSLSTPHLSSPPFRTKCKRP